MDTSKLTALISQYHVHTMENRAMGKLPLHSSERLNVQLLTQIATYVSVATTLKQSAKRKNPQKSWNTVSDNRIGESSVFNELSAVVTTFNNSSISIDHQHFNQLQHT